jgi:endonuclease/exonuclease/phosphatase family metal-dependent hydrolase
MVRILVQTSHGPVTVIGTHLESAARTQTRTRQIEVVLARVRGERRTVVAGDMNMQPGSDSGDVASFLAAGLVSAQDETGQASASTARDPRFQGDRPDWIFVSSDLAIADFEIVATEAPDHRPMVVTVAV